MSGIVQLNSRQWNTLDNLRTFRAWGGVNLLQRYDGKTGRRTTYASIGRKTYRLQTGGGYRIVETIPE